MRALMIAATLTVAGCGGSSSPPDASTFGEPVVLGPGQPFDVAEFEPGDCAFDLRAQVSLVDRRGEVVWQTDIPWVPDWGTVPAVFADGNVVVAFAQVDGTHGLLAVDVDDGTPIWQLSSVDAWHELRAVEDDAVAIGQSVIARFDAATGDMRWAIDGQFSVRSPDQVGPTDQSDEIVLIDSVDRARAISTADGADRWAADAPTSSWTPVSGAVDGDRVTIVVTETDDGAGRLDALDEASGELRWSQALSGVPERNLWVRGEIVTAQFDASFESWQLDSGTPLGSSPSGPEPAWAVSADDVVAVFAPPTALSVFDGGSGTPAWSASYPTAASALWGAAVHHEQLVVSLATVGPAGGGAAAAHDLASGSVGWFTPLDVSAPTAPRPFADVILVGGTVSADDGLLVDARGSLVALDAVSGHPRWRTQFRDSVRHLMASGAGVVAITSDDSVFCD